MRIALLLHAQLFDYATHTVHINTRTKSFEIIRVDFILSNAATT